MNTPLYLLRAIQLGLHMDDMEKLEYGTVVDMFTESANDQGEYREMANQSDFDKF